MADRPCWAFGATLMSATRIGRILARWWAFIAAVVIAALAGTILWSAFGPVTFRSEAELLLVVTLPPDTLDRQYGIESSRAQASAVIIEDLARLAGGRELLREATAAAGPIGQSVNIDDLAETIEVFPLARGLRIELAWPDGSQAQAIVDAMADLILKNQLTYYPSLDEVGQLHLVDKTERAIRPAFVLVVLDVLLKTFVAAFAAVAIALLIDWRANRLFAEDVPELLGMHVVGHVR